MKTSISSSWNWRSDSDGSRCARSRSRCIGSVACIARLRGRWTYRPSIIAIAWRTIVARCASVSEVSLERSSDSGVMAAESVRARVRGRVRVAGMVVGVG